MDEEAVDSQPDDDEDADAGLWLPEEDGETVSIDEFSDLDTTPGR